MSEEKKYTLTEVSESMNIGKSTLRTYVAKGILTTSGKGSYRQMLFTEEDIKNFLRSIKWNSNYIDGVEQYSTEVMYLTSNEVAKLVGVSQSTISNYCKRGVIQPDFVTPSNTKRFSVIKMQAFVLSMKPVEKGGRCNVLSK